MAWPTDDISTTLLDQGADSAASARAQILTVAQRVKDVIAGRNTANGIAPLDAGSKVPTANIPALSYLPLTGGTVSGATTFSSSLAVTGAVTFSSTMQVTGAITSTTGNISANAGAVTAFKNSQTSYNTAGLQSTSTTGNAGAALHCSGASAAYIEHVRSGNGVRVLDGAGASAAVTAKQYLFGNAGTSFLDASAASCSLEFDTNDFITHTKASNVMQAQVNAQVGWTFDGSFFGIPKAYAQTTVVQANVVVDANGLLYRSTSLRRHKADIRPLFSDATFDEIQPVQYRSTIPTDHDRYGVARNFFGFIADDAAQVVPEAVTWDSKGNPEDMDNRALIALLWAEVQSLRRRVVRLEGAE